MKARLVPLYFESAQDPDFLNQVNALRSLLADEAEILEAVQLGLELPDADAVVFPQMLGNAYRRLDDIQAIRVPILVITSEFGTVSMWDWEINNYLKDEGIQVIAPYNLEQAQTICRALALKRTLRQAKFLVFQDNPGEGFQASIFKRFYWWEDKCTQRVKDKFGIEIHKRSFKELGGSAKAIPEDRAEATWQEWMTRLPLDDIPQHSLYSAIKLYLALRQVLKEEDTVLAIGINCLNESHFSDTTPCMAWNMLFEERGLIWGCEADTLAMLTKLLIYQTLRKPLMMTNLYPFLMEQAALKHERIPDFPAVDEHPENHILAAHCGYLGVVPQSFAVEWKLRRKVLAIVDENSIVIDARIPVGEITLVKLDASLKRLSVVEGMLKGYAQFSGSDCLNGAVIRVPDGHKLMSELASHHYILVVGHHLPSLRNVARVFDLELHLID